MEFFIHEPAGVLFMPKNFNPETETQDAFLGGRVTLVQPKNGYRAAMDTVLLAASVPARAGDRVMEGGIGSAGASLCLAARVPDISIDAIERQDQMIELATRNIALNDKQSVISVLKGDIKDRAFMQTQYREGRFDHVMINPPFLEPGTAHKPPMENKGLAHMDDHATLKDWVNFCLYHGRHKASISVIYRADRLDELVSKLYGRVGDLHILPICSFAGDAANRVLVQGRKGTKGATVILPPLVMHNNIDAGRSEPVGRERFSDRALSYLHGGMFLDLGIQSLGKMKKTNE